MGIGNIRRKIFTVPFRLVGRCFFDSLLLKFAACKNASGGLLSAKRIFILPFIVSNWVAY
jgi:hypothetical protein